MEGVVFFMRSLVLVIVKKMRSLITTVCEEYNKLRDYSCLTNLTRPVNPSFIARGFVAQVE